LVSVYIVVYDAMSVYIESFTCPYWYCTIYIIVHTKALNGPADVIMASNL